MMCSHFFPFRCCYCNMAHLKCSGTCHPQLIILVQTTTSQTVQSFKHKMSHFIFIFFLRPLLVFGVVQSVKKRDFLLVGLSFHLREAYVHSNSTEFILQFYTSFHGSCTFRSIFEKIHFCSHNTFQAFALDCNTTYTRFQSV